MRKAILILLMLAGFVYGQSYTVDTSYTIRLIDDTELKPHYDTVKAIFLVTDNTEEISKAFSINGYVVYSVEVSKAGNKGYGDYIKFQEYDEYIKTVFCYLNSSKKQLPSRFIIWQYK